MKSRRLEISRDTLLYIAGPLTSSPEFPNQVANENAAMLVGVRWFKRGYNVYIPHMNTRGFECFGVQYETFMESCFAIIRRCDGIVMMKGWPHSKGASREYVYAQEIGKTIFFDEYFDKYLGGSDGS